MPSSISTVRLVGVPSSSIESESRRAASVPSSTTVTPWATACRPICPAKAEVFLRLKSPSSPWPTASCSITPGQPAPSTTSISPAGAGTASRLTIAWRTASSTALFLAPALARDDRHIDPDQRAHVPIGFPIGAQDLDHLPGRGDAGRHLPHALVLLARIGVDLLQQLDLGFERRRGERIVIGIDPAIGASGRLRGMSRIAALDGADRVRGARDRGLRAVGGMRIADRVVLAGA